MAEEEKKKSSSCVYVADKKHAWLPGNVVSYSDDGKATVKVHYPDNRTAESTVKLSDYPNKALPLQNVDEGGNLIVLEDMVDLPSLHEAAILYNLKSRHEGMKPYTRVGDIVIACNPFQWIDGLYSNENRSKYVEKLIFSTGGEGTDLKSEVEPHVYETSSLAYRGLAVDGHHQSILVSGESGAGKTETVKIVMSHLASVQGSECGNPTPSSSDAVIKRVVDSNPLLEAFGNAKTTRNNNSSRFGKYIQLQFDVEDATSASFSGRAVPRCVLAGSNCETYLLEKSRVVGHEDPERTYHIFYQLIAAPDDVKEQLWDGLKGTKNSSFRYVGDCTPLKIDGLTDAEQWVKTVNALSLVGVVDDKLTTLMRAICTVMQLGNLTVGPDPSDDEKSIITSQDELEKLASLMGMETEDVAKALTTRTVTAGRESYAVPMKVDESRDACDAFAKEIYERVFDWLVRNINAATTAEHNYEDAADVAEFGLVGLLDIFGFESFKINRFEQLCINYANEKLQGKYLLDIFRSVQDEYEYEGIALGDVPFTDNSEVLKLIEGRMGLVAILNEECVRPSGNDTSFVSKLKTVNKDISVLVNERLHRPTEFGIEHYAGPVKYNAEMFVQKNTDVLPKDLLDCACKSSNDLISTELKAKAEASAAAPTTGRGRSKKSALTVGTKFRTQLTSLMANISKTRTRYIRCIKPNPEKEPVKLDLLSSAQQLRCAGVVSAVTISRVAFPNRLTHETAVQRFRCLGSAETRHDLDKLTGQGPEQVNALIGELLKEYKVKGEEDKKAFEVGKTRVYFRTGALEHLESERMKALAALACNINRMVRGFIARAAFIRLHRKAVAAQALARRTIARKKFMAAKRAAIAVANWRRMIKAKRELKGRQETKAASLLQTRWRIVRAVAMLLRNRKAAIMIQKVVRGTQQRPKYEAMKKEAQEEARVNSKVAALQKRLADAEMKWIQADKARIEAEKRAEGMVAKEEDVETKGEEKVAMTDQQHAVMQESGQMLGVLQQEVLKLRQQNFALRSDMVELKGENNELASHNESLEANFQALKQHAHHMSQMNMKLQVQANSQKKGIVDLKRELNKSRFMHRSEMNKMQEVMKAKEALHEAQLEEMRVELETARYRADEYEAELDDGMGYGMDEEMTGGKSVEEGKRAEGESPPPKAAPITRATFGGQSSLSYYSRYPSTDMEEDWDYGGGYGGEYGGYGSMYGSGYGSMYGSGYGGGYPSGPPRGGRRSQRSGRRAPPPSTRSVKKPLANSSLGAAAASVTPAPKPLANSSLGAAAASVTPAPKPQPNSSLGAAAQAGA